jgi:hypothetical protein
MEELPQWAHKFLEDIECDDNEFSGKANFGNSLRLASVERDAGDNVFVLTGFAVSLAFCYLACEDDVSYRSHAPRGND